MNSASEFGLNEQSRRLEMPHEQCTHTEPTQPSFVLYSAIPYDPRPELIDTTSDEFYKWLNPNARRYAPDLGGLFVPFQSTRARVDGVLAIESYRQRDPEKLSKYLLITKTGYVERGRNLALCYKGDVVFRLTPMIAELWQFVLFTNELYRLARYSEPCKVLLNMVNTKGAQLSHLGKGWIDPFNSHRLPEEIVRCDEPHVTLSIDNLAIESSDDEIEQQVRRVARLVDNAFGYREARSFNHPNDGDPSQLNPRFVSDPWS